MVLRKKIRGEMRMIVTHFGDESINSLLPKLEDVKKTMSRPLLWDICGWY